MREGKPGDLNLSGPATLQREAIRYRYAVTGCIGTDLASELTNSINGVINYTQTLVDIDQQGGDQQQAAHRYQALVNEVQKTADLVALLQRVGQWQSAPASSVSLKMLFQMLTLLLNKPLRADSIVLSLPVDCSHEVAMTAGDLWLVLLTLIHQGRQALNRIVPGKQTEKWLRLEGMALPGNDRRFTLTLTNSAAAWDDEGSGESIWPSRTFCTLLLHRHQVALTAPKVSGGTHLILELPCRNSVV